VSTVLLTDQRQQSTSIHPPDTEDREILNIPDRADQRRLPFTDRLSLRVGLWLLHRSLNQTSLPAREVQDLDHRPLTEHEAITLLTHGLQQRSLL